MTARAPVFDDRLPSSDEIESANELRKILAGHMRDNEPTRLKVAFSAEERAELILMPALARSFMELLRHVASGRAVTIVPTDEMLTTQQSADILNVSRPHLVKLLEQGAIAFTIVGRHRRVRAQDVFTYRKGRDAERAAALSELAGMDADLI